MKNEHEPRSDRMTREKYKMNKNIGPVGEYPVYSPEKIEHARHQKELQELKHCHQEDGLFNGNVKVIRREYIPGGGWVEELRIGDYPMLVRLLAGRARTNRNR